jgi:hypothetical protein
VQTLAQIVPPMLNVAASFGSFTRIIAKDSALEKQDVPGNSVTVFRLQHHFDFRRHVV